MFGGYESGEVRACSKDNFAECCFSKLEEGFKAEARNGATTTRTQDLLQKALSFVGFDCYTDDTTTQSGWKKTIYTCSGGEKIGKPIDKGYYLTLVRLSDGDTTIDLTDEAGWTYLAPEWNIEEEWCCAVDGCG
jgi:hypothetical protein